MVRVIVVCALVFLVSLVCTVMYNFVEIKFVIMELYVMILVENVNVDLDTWACTVIKVSNYNHVNVFDNLIDHQPFVKTLALMVEHVLPQMNAYVQILMAVQIVLKVS